MFDTTTWSLSTKLFVVAAAWYAWAVIFGIIEKKTTNARVKDLFRNGMVATTFCCYAVTGVAIVAGVVELVGSDYWSWKGLVTSLGLLAVSGSAFIVAAMAAAVERNASSAKTEASWYLVFDFSVAVISAVSTIVWLTGNLIELFV